MKKFNKKLIISLLILSTIGIIYFLLIKNAQAADFIEFNPQIPVPGLDYSQQISPTDSDGNVTSILLANYIQALYQYGLNVAGILAAIMLMAGGVVWLTSGGSETKVSQAKEIISGSIIGLVILFSAWMLLNTINPELLKLKGIKLISIKPNYLGCCQYSDKAEMSSNTICEKNNGTFLEKSSSEPPLFYYVDPTGKKCELSGCCVTKYSNDSGQIATCRNSMKSNCDTSYTGVVFYDGISCSKIPDSAACASKTDPCDKEGAKDGDRCFGNQWNLGTCFCYNSLAWNGAGKYGEPCGNEGGTCGVAIALPGAILPTCVGDNLALDVVNFGRRCETDLSCCYKTD